jgi:predicted flavoprotein YhiN
VDPRPALVPLTFTAPAWQPFAELAGLSLEVEIGVPGAPRFVEDLLFTHRGLSGPGVLQASSFWREGLPLSIDLSPGRPVGAALREAREGTRQTLGAALAGVVPRRLALAWLADPVPEPGGGRPSDPATGARGSAGPPPEPALAARRLAELGNRALDAVAARLHDWRVLPAGTEGWRKAEVTAGGVATDELDARTMQAHRAPGTYWIGEVVDVTGWLGGYNFQWAWSSAWCAAHAIGRG